MQRGSIASEKHAGDKGPGDGLKPPSALAWLFSSEQSMHLAYGTGRYPANEGRGTDGFRGEPRTLPNPRGLPPAGSSGPSLGCSRTSVVEFGGRQYPPRLETEDSTGVRSPGPRSRGLGPPGGPGRGLPRPTVPALRRSDGERPGRDSRRQPEPQRNVLVQEVGGDAVTPRTP